MFDKIKAFLKDLFSKRIAFEVLGYLVFMTFFYLIGATRAQFDALVAIVALTGIYLIGLKFVKKITEK